jgi:hypothetical protein
MSCKHLQELYEVCRVHNLMLSSTDLIRIVCPICRIEEQCPSVLCEQYDAKHKADDEPSCNEPRN